MEKEKIFFLKYSFNAPPGHPLAIRYFKLFIKTTSLLSKKESDKLYEQVVAMSDFDEQLDHPEKIIQSLAILCPKIKPFTPYEIEIIERYANTHRDCALLREYHIDLFKEMDVIKEKYKIARQVMPEIRKEFDKLLENARIVKHPEDENVTLAGFPAALIEQFNEIAIKHQEKYLDVNRSYIKWWHQDADFDTKVRKLDEDIFSFNSFFHEFFEDQERFTLVAQFFNEDLTKFTEKIHEIFGYFKAQQPILDAFKKDYEAIEKEWKELHEYISKDALRNLKRSQGN